MTYLKNYNNMGCCGFNPTHSQNTPISLYGIVDSEEEKDLFLARCKEQLLLLHPKYEKGLPVYWAFKHPDVNKWYVSYQVPCNEGVIYKDGEILAKQLKYNKPSDYYTLHKTYKEPSPLDVYMDTEDFEVGKDKDVFYVYHFGIYLADFLFKEKLAKKGQVCACTLYALSRPSTQEILTHIKRSREVLFDVKWHNPYYTLTGKELVDTDVHTLHTFFYRMS